MLLPNPPLEAVPASVPNPLPARSPGIAYKDFAAPVTESASLFNAFNIWLS